MINHRLLGTAFLLTWLAASVRLAGPVLLAALGEVFSEQSGVLNVGIEGTMLLGALASFLTSLYTGSPWLGLIVALGAGLSATLLLAWMYVTVQANQVIVGLVFNVLAIGIASTVYRHVHSHTAIPQTVAMFQPVQLPWLSKLPLIGPLLFSQAAPLYLTLLLVVVAQLALLQTRFGLSLRASGENPHAAAAAGISVHAMRYAGVLISGAAAGLSGGYLVLAQAGLYRDSIVSGQGFIALGIVIFGRWVPWKAALAAFVFGACEALQFSLQVLGVNLPPQLLQSLPYLITIVAISGLFGSRAVAPAALTEPYPKPD